MSYIDMLWRDTTGNGFLDTLLMDTNHDHKFNKVLKDTSDGRNGPEKYDIVLVDSRGQGFLDAALQGHGGEEPASARSRNPSSWRSARSWRGTATRCRWRWSRWQ